MTTTIWFVVLMGNYEVPDFYINNVPFWMDKSRTYFVDVFQESEYWLDECRKWHQPEGLEFVTNREFEEDYD